MIIVSASAVNRIFTVITVSNKRNHPFSSISSTLLPCPSSTKQLLTNIPYMVEAAENARCLFSAFFCTFMNKHLASIILTCITFPHMISRFTDASKPQWWPISSSSANMVSALGHWKLLVHCVCGKHAYIQLLRYSFFRFHIEASNSVCFINFCNKYGMKTDH